MTSARPVAQPGDEPRQVQPAVVGRAPYRPWDRPVAAGSRSCRRARPVHAFSDKLLLPAPGRLLSPLILEPRLIPSDVVHAPPLAVVLVALALDHNHDSVVALALEVGVDVLPLAVLGDAAAGVARVLHLVIVVVVPELGLLAAAVINAGALAVPAVALAAHADDEPVVALALHVRVDVLPVPVPCQRPAGIPRVVLVVRESWRCTGKPRRTECRQGHG